MKNLEQHVGRKVKGVSFVSEKHRGIDFNDRMNAYIGCEGVIKEYYEDRNSFKIAFESPVKDFWHYPVEVILPQIEGEIKGYLIEDEKYAKIIAGLVEMSVNGLLKLSGEKVHFWFGSAIYDKVVEYDLLDKCTPVYADIIKLPKINGYEGEDMGDYLQYGCAKLLKSWFDSSESRHIASMTLDSGVTINKEQINKIQEYLLSKRK